MWDKHHLTLGKHFGLASASDRGDLLEFAIYQKALYTLKKLSRIVSQFFKIFLMFVVICQIFTSYLGEKKGLYYTALMNSLGGLIHMK